LRLAELPGATVWLVQQWNPGTRFALLGKPGSGTHRGNSAWKTGELRDALHYGLGGVYPQIDHSDRCFALAGMQGLLVV